MFGEADCNWIKILGEIMAYPVFGRCPVCEGKLEVTQLRCPQCDTTINGHYALTRFHQLTAEQLSFVETFVRCEGKLNRVEEELGVSYPTVRNRLNEVLVALGYRASEEPPTLSPEQRRAILDRLAAGEISSDEAVELLKTRS